MTFSLRGNQIGVEKNKIIIDGKRLFVPTMLIWTFKYTFLSWRSKVSSRA